MNTVERTHPHNSDDMFCAIYKPLYDELRQSLKSIMWLHRLMDATEIKKANILYHNSEAETFEYLHPEAFSQYEKHQISKNINQLFDSSDSHKLCIDIGCGTGLITAFELPLYRTVVAVDISKKMLEIVKKRFVSYNSPSLLLCDADFLPLRTGIADLVSVSSVLHHLPKLSKSLREISRLLGRGGFLYITREPNFQRFRRLFDSLYQVIRKIAKYAQQQSTDYHKLYEPDFSIGKFDTKKVDVQLPKGLHIDSLRVFFDSEFFKILSAHSYYWVHPITTKGLLGHLTKTNFLLEKIPFFKRIGIFVTFTARKL